MYKIKIKFQHCYGIKKLEKEFDFSSSSTFAIYASNGIMKTSFAKTFKNISDGDRPKDIVFPERETICDIKKDDSQDLKPKEIFVIEPYNENDFDNEKVLVLVAEKGLRKEYYEIYKEVEKEKNDFIKKLKATSQSTDCELEFISTFSQNKKDAFIDVLDEKSSLFDVSVIQKYDFKYNDVFDKKGNVKKFLEKNKDFLDQYIESYELVISKSDFFKKSNNTFGNYQAQEILKSVNDDSFFEAGHVLELSNNSRVDSYKDFKRIIDEEITKILKDEKIRNAFDKIDKAIGANSELRAFKKVLEKNELILINLKDYDKFKEEVWIGYIQQLKEAALELLKSYNSKKEQLEKIISKAVKTRTAWENTLSIFNARFGNLPYRVVIQNKEDVILKTETPAINFIFEDGEEEANLEGKKALLEKNILSMGEKRALYILNIIFEIEARRREKQETLFVIDDIADSFDYKNKYAIMEYLKDISKEENFYQIILTHNFDFFRSIAGRIIGNDNKKRKYKLNVIKTDEDIRFIEEKYQHNPFKYFRENLKNEKILISSIPFVRNLAEFCGQEGEYQRLTSFLHVKPDTKNLTIKDLEDIIKIVLKNQESLVLDNHDDKVIDVIFRLAEEISQKIEEESNLEDKIILSIAIRLKAELFVKDKLKDSEVDKNQTFFLIEKYKKEFSDDKDNIKILGSVNLMTPENIHFNSFMYEPILDMGVIELAGLYKKLINMKPYE